MAKLGIQDGKFMSSVKVGPKGQIVIPSEVREMLNIAPGDSLLLLADKDRGIALLEHERAQQAFAAISNGTILGGDENEGH